MLAKSDLAIEGEGLGAAVARSQAHTLTLSVVRCTQQPSRAVSWAALLVNQHAGPWKGLNGPVRRLTQACQLLHVEHEASAQADQGQAGSTL